MRTISQVKSRTNGRWLRVFLSFLSISFAAFFSMGDGGCSTVTTNDKTWNFGKEDVCGKNAPRYWRADRVGRAYKIQVNKGPEYILYKEGVYSEPILLECLENDGDLYIIYEYRD